MKQHSDVVAGFPHQVADFGRREVLDLAEVEDFPLQRRETVETLPHGEASFARCHRSVWGDRRPDPSAVRIEPRLEGVLE
jgi:hypothetical protein